MGGFHWGAVTSFTAYVKSVSVKYTLFTPADADPWDRDGEPRGDRRRAAGPEPDLGGAFRRRVHTVVAGDSLPSIAWREYGDPTVWRIVAQANDIDDPLRLRAGTTLLLPAADEI